MKFGAHVSIRGAIHLAVDRAVAIGCECLQIFVGSPRQWREIIYSERDLDLFVEKRKKARLDPLVAHTAYLINLAAADMDLYRRSTSALMYALRIMDRLGGLAAITHLGSRGERPWPDALARIDRHENIGQGRIGRRGFTALVNHPRLRRLPGFIETPGFDHAGPDRRNLLVLKKLRAGARKN